MRQSGESSMSSNAKEARGAPVLLYDGECGLCNRSVRFLLAIDRTGLLRFAPLQSEPGQAWLRANGLPVDDFSSLVFIRDWEGRAAGGPGAYALRTDGLVAALEAGGGIGRVLAFIRYFPRSWRDGVYRLVARIRYRIFGPWRDRPLARPEMRKRFIAGGPAS
jgi:predicted DCC family thiol-disulfide oxidoreductase YuxK